MDELATKYLIGSVGIGAVTILETTAIYNILQNGEKIIWTENI